MKYYFVVRYRDGDYFCSGNAQGPRAAAKLFDLDSIQDFLGTGYIVECYINDTAVPLPTPLFLGVSGQTVSYVHLIECAGPEECVQGLLVALQDTTLSAMSIAMPTVASETLFKVIYAFDPPGFLMSSFDYLSKILGRIRALNAALAPADQGEVVALTVDSVRQLIYEQDREQLYATIREIYKFRGSIDHFVKVPQQLLRELHFVVTRREAKASVMPEELVKEIAGLAGCVSERIERDADTVAFAEKLKELRETVGLTEEVFAKVSGIELDAYKAFERADISPTIPDVTALLSGMTSVLAGVALELQRK